MKNRAKRISVFFLLLCLVCSFVFSVTAETGPADPHPTISANAEEITVALERAFADTATTLENEVAKLRESGEIWQDSLGNPVDMEKLFATFETNISILKNGNLTFDAYKLALVESFYRGVFIGEYASFSGAASSLVYHFASSYYLDKLTTEALVTDTLIRSYQATVDKYGSYYTEEEWNAQEEEVNYVGIGISVLVTDDGYAEVIQVFKDSSAEEAGVLPGDIIVGVNSEDFATLGYNDAIDLIRGEEGTTVSITLRRGDKIITLEMERRQTTSYSVTYEVLNEAENGKTGFIRISSFNETTFTQFCEAVEALEEEGVVSYIFDVSSNTGGSLESVLGVLDYILPDDTALPLVRLAYKDQTPIEYDSIDDYLYQNYSKAQYNVKKVVYEKAQNHKITQPIAVLCNGGTASAAELFVSCLRDFDYAKVIGETTYGKGVGQQGYRITDYYEYNQQTYYFLDGSLLFLTAFYYAPPTSSNYDGVGIVPDQTVALSDEAKGINLFRLEYSKDSQLQAAVAYIETVDVTTQPPHQTPSDVEEGAPSTLLFILLGVLVLMLLLVLTLLFLFMKKGRQAPKDRFFSESAASKRDSDLFRP